jgi:hypothetical protein
MIINGKRVDMAVVTHGEEVVAVVTDGECILNKEYGLITGMDEEIRFCENPTGRHEGAITIAIKKGDEWHDYTFKPNF